MFVHYRTKCFFLKKENRGEADQLFTVYTKDFGKLDVLAKAIRKISSKLRSAAEIFYLSEIEFIQGKGYKTLTDAILIEKFDNIKKDLNKLAVAYKISGILDEFIRGQEADEKLWQLLNEVFYKLNDGEGAVYKPELIYYYFFWNIASILGYRPNLSTCYLCKNELAPQKLYFNSKEGGVSCLDCFEDKDSAEEIEIEIIKILRIILKRNLQILLKLKIEEKYFKRLESISKDYLKSVLDRIK